MVYRIKQLAELAGISVRTLHHYDRIGLLRPESHTGSGYRQYGEASVLRLQQIMFFREVGFNLEDIEKILSRPGFDVLEALKSHRILLTKKAEGFRDLIATVDKTIRRIKGETTMQIKEYYHGFSDEQIERYRREVNERWGEEVLQESERRVIDMGKVKFATLQVEGGKIF